MKYLVFTLSFTNMAFEITFINNIYRNVNCFSFCFSFPLPNSQIFDLLVRLSSEKLEKFVES